MAEKETPKPVTPPAVKLEIDQEYRALAEKMQATAAILKSSASQTGPFGKIFRTSTP